MLVDHLPAHADLVVDVGCGGGWLGSALLRRDPSTRVLCIDVDAATLDAALAATGGELDGVRADAVALPLRDGVAEAAVALHVVHLVARPDRVVAELLRVTRPGGVVLVGVPFDGGWADRLGLVELDRLSGGAVLLGGSVLS